MNTNQPPGSAADPHHGVVLTHTGGKLIGIVFTRVPLPDLNPTGPNNMPPGNGMPPGTSMPPGNVATPVPVSGGTNINPTMLANLQNTANLTLLNAANNPNVQHLQNTLRQQQQQQMMGSPAPGGQQQGQQGQQQNMNGK